MFARFCGIFILSVIGNSLMVAGQEATIAAEQRMFDMAEPGLWIEDYAKAFKLSQATGRPLLLAFVGSDWCPWSQKMVRDVISKTEFLGELQGEMIFVWVDFPQQISSTLERKTQNQGLRNRFAVQELPTIVLVDPSGDEIAKFGYLPLSAQEMAGQLRTAFKDYRQLKDVVGSPRLIALKAEELEKLYHKAKQLGREKEKKSLLEAGLKNEENSFFLMRQYEEMIEHNKIKDPSVQKLRRQIMSLDPSNHLGTHLQLAVAEFQVLSKKLKKKESPENALSPLVEYLKTYGPRDLENRWRVEMMIAQFLFSKDKVQDALCHAKLSYEVAPLEFKPEVAQSLEYIASKANPTYKK